MAEKIPHVRQAGRDSVDNDEPSAAFALNMLHALDQAASGNPDFQPDDHTALARRTIWRESDTIERVPVICRGWAMTTIALSDGRRQILSFLLPGDLVSAVWIFDLACRFSVEAITDLHYRSFSRTAIQAALARDATLFATLTRLSSEETMQQSRLAVDLGRRGAAGRIANLILRLSDRLAERGMAQDRTMDFPLRQHHIADATGLTVVHVGNTLAEFRRAGVVAINGRSLTIVDPAALRHVAGH